MTSTPELASLGPRSSNFDSGSGNFLGEADPELVNPDPKYECPIHKGLLRDPVQTLCGHRLCRACVGVYLDGQESKPCPVDDEDIERVTIDNIFPDPGFLREIKDLRVYCYHKEVGCKEIVKYRNLMKHKAICPYQPVLCQYHKRGCVEKVLLTFQAEHEKNCRFRPAHCDQCGQEFLFKDVADHEKNHCPEGVIACPYQCGTFMKRREVEDHTSVCPMKPGECQFKILGCEFKGDKAAVAAHERNFEFHFDILVTFVCKMKMEPSSRTQELVGLKDRIESLDELGKKMTREIKVKHVGNLERIIALERKVGDMEKELKETKDEIQTFIKAQIEQFKNAERQISKLEVRMAENDLRFQMIETANYDGNLLWKIRDFSVRRTDAVRGRTVSLYSQPFYSSRFGYKMCARVYLNGDGIGKGTHVSLYFVVMKGEYDALLPWPFQLKISLVLLDQSPQKRHLKDEFLPDPNSTSFQRPERAEMNVASGCPLFVAHSVIDNANNKYVDKDMLFIKVSVDCSQLTPV